MGKIKAGVRCVALAMVATLMLSGCIFPGGNEPGGAPVDTRLYLGPIPDPAPLPPAGELPPLPTPPVDYEDEAALQEYQAAIERYTAAAQGGQGDMMAFSEAVHKLVETARLGGAASIAAWQSLLVTAGHAVPENAPRHR